MINLLPDIHHPKKNKFSNPLSGIIYNNVSFLHNCQYNVEQQPQKPTKNQHHHKKSKSFLYTRKLSQKKPHNSKYCYATHYFANKTHEKQSKKQKIPAKTTYVERNQMESRKTLFNDLDIKILDAIESYDDFRNKRLKVNFGIYFNMLFKQELQGNATHQFLHLVEKYMRKVINKDELDKYIEVADFEGECSSIKNKFSFINKIKELQERNKFELAEQLVKFFCIPSPEFRESCLRDVLHTLKKQINEKFALDDRKDYILLNAEGIPIEDICEIYFSTTVLFLTEKKHYQKNFGNYLHLLQDKTANIRKLSFEESLRKTFRSKIVQGNFQDYSQKVQSTSLVQKEKIDLLMNGRKSQNEIKMARTTQNGFSTERKTSTTIRKKRDQTQTRKMNERNPIDSKYVHEFQRLKASNTKHDITFNHQHQNKVLMQVLKEECILFANKTPQQIEKIINAASLAVHLDSIEYDQYRKLRQIADCKGEKESIISFVRNYLPFSEYGQMSRADLSKMLQFLLSGKQNNREIIEEVIWSWFERNKLIENGKLLCLILESWYQQNKIAYSMLISLIFGTNQISAIDLAYEVII